MHERKVGFYRLICAVFEEKPSRELFSRWEKICSPAVPEGIGDMLETLTQREQYVLTTYYGLDGKKQTLQLIGGQLGYTKQRISQIKIKALRKMRHPTRMKKFGIVAEGLFSTTEGAPDKEHHKPAQEDLTEALSNVCLGEKIPLDVVNVETGGIIIPANKKITKTHLKKLAANYERIEISSSSVYGQIMRVINGFASQKYADNI